MSRVAYYTCEAYGWPRPTQQQIDGAAGFYRLAMLGSAFALIARIERDAARISLGQWPAGVEAP